MASPWFLFALPCCWQPLVDAQKAGQNKIGFDLGTKHFPPEQHSTNDCDDHCLGVPQPMSERKLYGLGCPDPSRIPDGEDQRPNNISARFRLYSFCMEPVSVLIG